MSTSTTTRTRIQARFNQLRIEKRCGLVTFTTACDPDRECFSEILRGLPGAGADLIEIGVPFSDPMADGPTIQAAGQRALAAGATLEMIFSLVKEFRSEDDTTPIILMTYLNPVEAFGVEDFMRKANDSGVDGAIIIDLPVDVSCDIDAFAEKFGIALIRLATPTTDDDRLAAVLKGTTGFLYYVSLKGVTGVDGLVELEVRRRVSEIKKQTDLPVAVGFGVRSPEQAASIAKAADAVVVGSAIIERIAARLKDPNGRDRIAPDVWKFVNTVAAQVRAAR